MSGNMRLGRGEEGEGRGRIATLTSTRSGLDSMLEDLFMAARHTSLQSGR
jgi:hypothetical protein